MNEIQNQLFQEDQAFAEVIVPLFLPTNYTWSIPPKWEGKIKPGCRVEVALRKRKYAGIVKSISTKAPEFKTQPILNILDNEPVIHQQQLKLWQWISDYYMCTEGEVMQAAIPANLKLSSESILVWNDSFDDEDLSFLEEEEYVVAEALSMHKELKISEIQQILDANKVYPVIKKLVDQKIGFIWEELKERYKEKKENFIELEPTYLDEKALEQLLNNWSNAPKQMELLLAYLHLRQTTKADIKQTDLLAKSKASHAQLNALIEKGILKKITKSVNRLPDIEQENNIDFQFSTAQKQAYDSIKQGFEEKQVCLLHGVTSSGKTEIYIQLISELIASGKQALYLLPEIALTAQITTRLRKKFGGNLVVYHSKFNDNERVEMWNNVKNGKTKIVLGARSALLLPFQNLGLIIVDEEHDPSYKQIEPAPRYQARDTAIYYANLFQAKVLLGSATPSIESYFNAQQKKYALVELMERYGNVRLPKIEIIDNRKASKKGELEKDILTETLSSAIDKTVLEDQKQVILFQNRRGYAPYIQCETCGWIPECTQCDVSLTLHKMRNKLTCHYCGTEYPIVKTCPACGNHHFIQKNFGTEQIEESVLSKFPNIKVGRMDLDTVKGKNDHERIINQFSEHKIDVLIGTQMVVKGLDFENVTLVGIVDADSILSFADFRVNERSFQLMEQVSGRAGRRQEQGQVYIQAIQKNHPVLQWVIQHDYGAMYQSEIDSRKAFGYPPFTRIIVVKVRHKDNKIAYKAAEKLKLSLSSKIQSLVKGPSEPLINRIRNQYIWELMIAIPRDQNIIKQTKREIQYFAGLLQAEKEFKSVYFIPDVDPA